MNTGSVKLFFTSLLILSSCLVDAQTTVKGKIIDGDFKGVPYATVSLVEAKKVIYSSEEGEFEFTNIPVGEYSLSISSIGYQKSVVQFSVTEDQTELQLEKVQLKTDETLLSEVVVTGTLKPVYLKDSPVKTEVVTSKYLRDNIAPMNLSESIFLINGVQEVIGCGICYTNSISINGLPGPNTAILLDGMPIYGNLASVYGLNSIPNSVIDRIEIIKGPSSTLYGAEATAGVINVITKSPKNTDRLTAELKTTEHLETFANAAYTYKTSKMDVLLGGNYTKLANFDDNNNDQFSDVVHLDQYGAFSKFSFSRKSKKRLDLALKYYYEDRRNGVDEYLKNGAYKNLRGDTSIYGESVFTHRAELIGSYELPTKPNLRLDYSLSYHKQNSFYGADSFNANQKIVFANFLYNKTSKKHDFILGLANRYQYYDDNTFATEQNGKNNPENQYIPGVFLQDEWLLNKGWVLLSGLRMDHYNDEGLIFSPRINVKKKIGNWTNMRFNTGTGFRVVNIFTEEHTALSRGSQVVFEDDLKPERSYNATLNVNHLYTAGKAQGSIDIDFFYTYFSNRIVGDFSSTAAVYRNLEGYSVSRGVSLNISHKSKSPFTFTLGGILLSAFTKDNENGVRKKAPISFSTTWSLVNTLNYRFKKSKLLLALTTKVVGPINLNIAVPNRPEKSEPFVFQTVQLTKTVKKFELYTGVQNLWSYVQNFSPLYGTDGPENLGFSDDFNTDYAYGPLEGRELYFGVRLSIE
ncbi:MAG: TonB-dependent receptor [Cyclobacteriaceae bacterium]